MLTAGLIAALAATAAALPGPCLQRRTSPNDDCSSGDTSSVEGVQSILDNIGPIDYLDILLHSNFPKGEDDWVDELWELQFPDQGTSPLDMCGSIDGTCSPDDLCQDYANAMGYWALHSVAVLHSKINSVHQTLQWDGWLAGLSIDQIGDDFAVPVPDMKWATWIAVAFSVASGAIGAVEGSALLGGMAGIASAGFVATANSGDDAAGEVDTTSVENTLRNMIGAAGNYMSTILSAATGNGDPSILPISVDSTLQTATARFYSDPHILLDIAKDNSSFISIYDKFGQNIQSKLVDAAMTTAWYTLVGDKKAEEDCNFTGAQYLEYQDGKSLCFYLSRSSGSKCGDNDVTKCSPYEWETPLKDSIKNSVPSGSISDVFPSEIYDKLGDTYGFDRVTYYTSLIDCTINGDGATIDTSATTGDLIPRCFYTLPVKYGEWKDVGVSNYLELSDLADSGESS